MPTYVYQCTNCQEIFDVQAAIKEKAAGLTPVCPQCASFETLQLITAGLLITGSGKSSFGPPGCGPGSRPGCCG